MRKLEMAKFSAFEIFEILKEVERAVKIEALIEVEVKAKMLALKGVEMSKWKLWSGDSERKQPCV